MRVAVITPCYQPDADWLRQCCQSVRAQTVPCGHILVHDGGEARELQAIDGVEVIQTPRAHGDAGNAARAIGSVSAVCRGYDAIAYLDYDNWYEANHLESLLDLHRQTGAAVCTSTRNIYHVNGTLLGKCPEVDGEKFVDTSCLLITRAAFSVISAWYLMPPALVVVCDRFVWGKIKELGLSHAHSHMATVAFRTQYRVSYEYFGVPAPPHVKTIVWDAENRRYACRETDPGA